MEDWRKVRCRCPKCHKGYTVDLPSTEQIVVCTCPGCNYSFSTLIYGEPE